MDSPFTRHFNTNYVPSDDQVAAIREIIRAGEDAMNCIDQKIHDSMEGGVGVRGLEELQALAESREKQRRVVETHRALISIVRRIDDDILTLIFLSVLDQRVIETRRGDPYGLTISSKHPGVVLSHVCQRWRVAALSTKPLWHHLGVWIPIYPSTLDAQDTWRAKVARLVRMTREWLSRSGTYHLRVEIKEWSSMLQSPGRATGPFINKCSKFHELVDVLCSSSARWKSLDMEIGVPRGRFPKFPTTRLLSLPLDSIPMLTNVRFHCQVEQPQSSPSLVATSTILHPSTLRSLELGPGVIVQDIVTMPVVWSTLEHLVFYGYPTNLYYAYHALNGVKVLQLFSQCPNLVTCCIPLQSDVGDAISASCSPISLPRLTELSLFPHLHHIPKGFASSLILPSLRKLVVLNGHVFPPCDDEESGLVEIFEIFGSTLEDITFCYKSLSPSALHRALQYLPNVSSLALVSHTLSPREHLAAKLDNDLMMELSPTFNQANTRITRLPLCPKIEVFRFDTGGSSTLAERALVDFIQARRMTVEGGMEVARLREVDCGGYRFRDIDPVETLRRQGVDVDQGDFVLKNWVK